MNLDSFKSLENELTKNIPDRLKKGILAETKRARQLKGRCIYVKQQ
jgi:hypothetical protein